MPESVRPHCDFRFCPGASVRAEIKGRSVSLQPKQVRIELGATVTWRFSGVPDGYQPLIRFLADSEAVGFDTGPFEVLGLAGDKVIGFGVKDVQKRRTCRYEVILVPSGVGKVLTLKGKGSVAKVGVDVRDPPPDG